MQPHEPTPDSDSAYAAQETGRQIRKYVRILVIVLVAGFVIVHCIKSYHEYRLSKAADEAASARPQVNVITAEEAKKTQALKLPGETAAWYESIIYARVNGYVGKWTADIGDSVKKGQVLATIETPDLDAELAASEAKLTAAQALIKARQADAEFAKTTYDRWRNSPKGVVSEQEREAKKAGYESAVAELNEAQAQAALDKADVDRYTVLAQFKQVIAPYDGKIIERHIDIGNLVTAGSSSNTTSLYKMAQNDPMRIFVDVPQSAAGDMNAGVGADITSSTISGKVFEGKITRTADAIDPQARTLKVEIDLPNSDQLLVPGTYVDVTFNIPDKGLLQLPAAALVFRSSGPEVAIVGSDGKVTFHKVTIARDNGNFVDISSGIREGDKVILNVSSQITDGEKVEINNPGGNSKND